MSCGGVEWTVINAEKFFFLQGNKDMLYSSRICIWSRVKIMLYSSRICIWSSGGIFELSYY